MASNIGDLVATATLDIAPFMTNTKNLKTYLKGLDNSLRSVENSFKTKGDKLNKMRLLYDQTGQSLTNYQKLLARQSDKYNQLKAEIGDVNNATEAQKGALLGARSEMTATAARVVELQGKYNALGRELSVFNQFGNAAIDFGNKMQSVSRSLGGVGSALTRGVTVPIAAGAGAVIKAAISWESAFAGVKKTNEEVVDSNGRVIYSYQDLENGLRGLATKLPASHQQIAAVAEAAGQLGIKTENVVSFTKTMIDMGESTNMSAEQAATSLARLANITKLPQDKFSNLGSAIVDLGNNFATTESEITEMALRLAGAGTQIGLTHGDILGLATALSSVGVEAEMGGSAVSKIMVKMQVAAKTGLAQMEQLSAKTGMTRRELELMSSNNSKGFKNLADSIGMTTNEMNGIIKSSRDLENFGKIAGMSAQEFKQAFEKDAIGAIQKFLQGLGDAEKHGSSAIEMLNEMGIKEVRLRDSLLRAANAQDLFKNAVARGNKAFKENTALTNEANKRYETTASKLKILRNELVETAIKFGGPLLDAIRNSVKAGEPYLKMLTQMADNFNSLDKAQQQNIINWGLLIAAAGPALSLFGKASKVIGSTSIGIGRFSRGIGWAANELKKLRAAKNGVTTITELSSAATGATAATGGLTGAIGLLGNPVTWGVLLGGAALLAIGYYSAKANEARQRTEEWGTAVSKTQATELQGFKNKVDETNRAIAGFGSGAVKDINNVKKAFKDLAAEITKLADEELGKKVKLAEKLGLSQETIKELTNQTTQIKNNVQQMSDEVINIYKNASEQHRQLTEEEKSVVLANQNELIKTQLSLMKYSGNEKIAITKAMNGQLDELNNTQISKAKKVVEGWIKDENKIYKERKSNLQKLYNDIRGEDEAALKAREEIRTKMQTLEAEHDAKMDAYGKKWIEIQKKLTDTALNKSTPEAQKAILDQMKRNASELGLSYDELVNKFSNASSKIQEESELWAKTTEKTTASGKLANTQWNAMVWDAKTGEIKTNAQEEIQKALQAEGGWEAMKFIVKEANLKTNAKIAIGEALVATDQWNSLTPEDKKLITDGKPAIEAILNSKEMLASWNAMPEQIKKILGNSDNFLSSAEAAQHALETWNLMTPTQQKLMIEDLASGNIETVRRAVETLTGTTIPIEAKNNTTLPAQEAQQTIDAVQQYQSAYINAKNNTQGEANAASAAVNNVKQNNPVGINARDLTGAPAASARGNINSVHGTTVQINAVDNASGVIGSIRGMLSTLADKTINIFTRHTNNAKGTNFHPGGLAMVNDQKGPLYRELVTLPTGESFIPEGRDVILPLPRGAKVLPANKTKRLFPTYANGIGFENTNIAQLTQRMGNLSSEQRVEFVNRDNSDVKNMLVELIRYLKDREEDGLLARAMDSIQDMAKRPVMVTMEIGKRTIAQAIAEPVAEEQAKREAILRAVNGEGW